MTTRADRTRGLLDNAPSLLDLGAFHLSALEFDRLIAAHGNSGELRRSIPCPCRRLDTGSPEVRCPDCRGQGVLWPAELREPVIFLDTQRRATARLSATGSLPHGTIQVTFPTGIIPSMGDLILPDNEEHVITETLYQEGAHRVSDEQLRRFRIPHPDQARRPAGPPRKERLIYSDPCCIEHVAYRDASGRLCRASPNEYSIGPDGTWTWTEGAGPEPGTAWVVRYRAPATYRVWTSSPVSRSEADEQQPQMVTASRLDLVQPGEIDR